MEIGGAKWQRDTIRSKKRFNNIHTLPNTYNLQKNISSLVFRYKTRRITLFNRQSRDYEPAKMFSPLIGILTWVSLMGMCQGDLESSNLSPLSIVYTVYPYYNSETLLGILKADEENLHLSRNDVPVGRNAETRENQNGINAGSRDEISRSTNDRDSRDDSNESTRQRTEQANTEITYWPPVQRGAVPKPRAGRAAGFQRGNLKNV